MKPITTADRAALPAVRIFAPSADCDRRWVAHRQNASSADHENHSLLAHTLNSPIMRRLMVIVLILWLPLQAWSAVFAAGCAGHGSLQRGAATDAAPLNLHRHADMVLPIVASESAHSSVAHSPGDAHAANNPRCADDADCCVAACGVLFGATAAPMATGTPAAAAARHGDEAFSSAPASQVLEPPIAAA